MIFHNSDQVQGAMNLIVFEVYIPLVQDPPFPLLNLQSFLEEYFTNLFLRLFHITIVIPIAISSSLILIDGSYSFEWPWRCHHDVNFCHSSVYIKFNLYVMQHVIQYKKNTEIMSSCHSFAACVYI